MQWQGDPGAVVPIVGLHKPGQKQRLMAGDDPRTRNLSGYGGSIAFSTDGHQVAVTSPRGGVVQVLDRQSGKIAVEHRLSDVCGLAAAGAGFTATTGEGKIYALQGDTARQLGSAPLSWDNHLIPLD
jgi:hypothetical protein